MRRYARRIGQVGLARGNVTSVWLVIRTDDVSPAAALGLGFESIPDELTDVEVMTRYAVRHIYTVTDARLADRPQ